MHGDVSETLPSNAPEALGKSVQLTHCVDADLLHDVSTGQSVTACPHFVNAMPVDWHSKEQSALKTAKNHQSLWQHGHVSSRQLTCATHCGAWELKSERRVTCLVTMSQWSTHHQWCIPSHTNVTMHCPSTMQEC